MQKRTTAFLLWIATLVAPTLHADVLELKNGKILDGKYMGGTATSVRFDVAGNLQVIPTRDILALTFTGSAPTAKPQQKAPPPADAEKGGTEAAKPPPPPPPTKVTLATGTSLIVRMKDGISSKNRAGTPFTTKLEYDLYVGKAKVLPAGSLLYGEVKSSTQARRAIGRSTLDLRLVRAVAGSAQLPVATTAYAEAGERAIKDAARGAAAGAAIGGIAGGSDGAKEGAAIGAIVGGLKRGQTITIPPGTLLEFKLAQPLTVTVGG